MATKYVNFGLSGTSHAGTENDPFSLADFVSDSKSGNTYKCRGIGALTALFSDSDTFTMEAWDVGLYGPWRIYGGTSYSFSAVNASMSDGIINADSVNLGGTSSDLSIHAYTDGMYSVILRDGAVISRCTFYVEDDMNVPAGENVEMDRCVFEWSNPAAQSINVASTASITITSSVTNSADEAALISGSGTATVDARYEYPFVDTWLLTGESHIWDDVLLKNFNRAPSYGVGAIGSWGETLAARFTSSTRSGVGETTVDFTDQSTGNPVYWRWDFGDGTTLEGSDPNVHQNPSHTYAAVSEPTDYSVTLTVANEPDGEAPSWVDDDNYYFLDEFTDDEVDSWLAHEMQDNTTIDTRADGKKVAIFDSAITSGNLFPEPVSIRTSALFDFRWRINWGDLSGANHSIRLEFYDTESGSKYFSAGYFDPDELVFDHFIDGGHGVARYKDSSPSAPSVDGYLDLRLTRGIDGKFHLYWSEDDGVTWTEFDDGTGDPREYSPSTASMTSVYVKCNGADEYGFEFFRFQTDDSPVYTGDAAGLPHRFVSGEVSVTNLVRITPNYAFPIRGYGYKAGRVAYHYGMPKNPEQGYGWSEITDGAWVWPDSPASLVSLNDSDGYRLALGNCSRDGLFWLLNTRDGPSSSTLVRRWLDKVDPNDSSSGTEIPATIKWPERVGSKQHFTMQHAETHIHVRPIDDDNRGASGYTDIGLRSSQEFSFRIYKDGEPDVAARQLAVPNEREMFFTRHVRGNTLQMEVVTVTSEFKIGRIESYFTVYDRARFPAKNSNDKTLSTTNHEEALSKLLFWVTRGEKMEEERRSQIDVGYIDSKTTGPDGKEKSGAIFQS